jgi:hypothetical protein
MRTCEHHGRPDQLQPEVLADGQACPRCGRSISVEMRVPFRILLFLAVAVAVIVVLLVPLASFINGMHARQELIKAAEDACRAGAGWSMSEGVSTGETGAAGQGDGFSASENQSVSHAESASSNANGWYCDPPVPVELTAGDGNSETVAHGANP